MAFSRHDGPPQSDDRKRVIDRPSDRPIRLIGDDGTQVGIVSVREALALAVEKGLDLVEIAPHLDPPTCKLLDWGRHQYQATKKRHKLQKGSGSKRRKEIQIRPKTDTHDLETKLRHAQRFLEGGHKVMVSLIFRGRELNYIEQESARLSEFAKKLETLAKIEQPVKREGRNRVTVILAPK
ncbi:MAG TPA: translation initiation factor IF-3 [Planctomycetota bacterium]|jgi:translation initiation factor IF-3|nr:translation initiation factor IF-3 [Planctomycetota bacterium]OQC20349.1 MAG: Translation initiation factor IF-3 [Planctomycetes bacterium ADurb.Bin069]HNR98666.1 translation initiation factor IF-3 [Planctomycetota bacterium]HNU25046.1 translation initiation factor IF-3 [Planctomycetota bacterium]HOE28470.1 translation initiation factor IF-3 [Planctomycetota bacterium]